MKEKEMEKVDLLCWIHSSVFDDEQYELDVVRAVGTVDLNWYLDVFVYDQKVNPDRYRETLYQFLDNIPSTEKWYWVRVQPTIEDDEDIAPGGSYFSLIIEDVWEDKGDDV